MQVMLRQVPRWRRLLAPSTMTGTCALNTTRSFSGGPSRYQPEAQKQHMDSSDALSAWQAALEDAVGDHSDAPTAASSSATMPKPRSSQPSVAAEMKRTTPPMKRQPTPASKVSQRLSPLHAFWENPLQQLSMDVLLAVGLQMGHHPALLHRRMLPYIIGERSGIHMIDLDQTMKGLQRALAVTTEIAAKHGTILFVGSHPTLQELTTVEARRCQAYFLTSGKWVAGTLTNMREVLPMSKRDVTNYTLAPNANEARQSMARSPLPKDPAMLMSPRTSYHPSLLPDLVICLDVSRNRALFKETRQMSVPTIGLCDTDVDPALIAYPIPGNDDNVEAFAVLTRLFSEAVRVGKILGQQRSLSASASASAADDRATSRSSHPSRRPSASQHDAIAAMAQ